MHFLVLIYWFVYWSSKKKKENISKCCVYDVISDQRHFFLNQYWYQSPALTFYISLYSFFSLKCHLFFLYSFFSLKCHLFFHLLLILISLFHSSSCIYYLFIILYLFGSDQWSLSCLCFNRHRMLLASWFVPCPLCADTILHPSLNIWRVHL